MASPFVHVEVLGPRASVDAWLAVIQDHAGCHLVDALHGLEGEAGIGRPLPTVDEREGATRRSEAAQVLRAVERILPPTPPAVTPPERPAWSIGGLGEGRADLEALVAEAREVGGELQRALEAARQAEHAADAAEAEALAVRALTARGEADLDGWLVSFPSGSAWADARIRRFVRRARRRGAYVASAAGRRQTVVVVRAEDAEVNRLGEEAAAAAGRPFRLADAVRPLGAAAARTRTEEELRAARGRDEEALAALRRAVDESGPRARDLLDGLEDAEARAAMRNRLAATEHLAAARAWVHAEEQEDLERRLDRVFGPEVVVRPLAPAADEPALPRAVAGVPFAALEGLRPTRYGTISVAALLGLAAPIATAVALSDMAAGLLFLLVGGVLGAGAPPGSPRRDTALLGQIAGVIALILGMGGGSIAGLAGYRLFGTGWGLLGDGSWAWDMDAFRTLLLGFGAAALLLAAWGGVAALRAAGRREHVLARSAAVTAATCLAIAGVASLGALAGSPLRWLWVVGPLGLLAVLVLAGIRAGAWRLLLEGVGVFRLAAVAILVVWAYEISFSVLARPGAEHFVLAPALLLAATLAVLVDPAHVAMGVPYDLSLASRGLATPFAPFARRVAHGRGARGAGEALR